jgi:D-arabinose 1-dehydrogenase-like Zn-dependent alcohol dehydrogenase
VESGLIPLERRISAYNRFAPLLSEEKLALVSEDEKTVGLAEVPELSAKMLRSEIRGRYVVDPRI